MRTVHVARNLAEAHLIAGFLGANGVEAFVTNENLWAVRGEIPMDASTAPGVVVRDGDHDRAKALLGERLAGGSCRT